MFESGLLLACSSPFLSRQHFRPKGFHGGSTVDSYVASPVKVDAASPTNTAPTQAAVEKATSGGGASASSSLGSGSSAYCKCGESKKTATQKFCGQIR